MLYAIHDESGRITQVNKIYHDPKGYDGQLNDLGHRFVKVQKDGIVPPEHWFVSDGKLRKRPEMFILVWRKTIKAGGTDATVLRGCPLGATYAVLLNGVTAAGAVAEGVVDDPDLAFPFDVPGKYSILIDRWPYQTFKVDIEAVA